MVYDFLEQEISLIDFDEVLQNMILIFLCISICFCCMLYSRILICHYCQFSLVRNVIGRIGEVNQRWAQLVLGWVINGIQINHFGIQPAIPVNSAWPSLHG